MMTFGQSIDVCLLKKYFAFKGRATRSEFWWFYLFIAIITWAAQGLDADLFGNLRYPVPLFEFLAFLGYVCPLMAVSFRRMHDINWGGWWIFIPYGVMLFSLIIMLLGLISYSMSGLLIVGTVFIIISICLFIPLIILLCLHGTRGPNRFGPPPVNPAPQIRQ